MLLRFSLQLVVSLYLVDIFLSEGFDQFNCLRNGMTIVGACDGACPTGFNGDANCNSCTDGRLSVSSNCTQCDDSNGDCLTGNFTLSVTFHSYLNRDSLCGECRLLEFGTGPVCCDTFSQNESCPTPCEFRFALSLEAYGEPLHYVDLRQYRPDFTTDNITAFPMGSDAFSNANVSNPYSMQLDTWTGMFQMYIVVYDSYRPLNGNGEPQSQGRFAVDRFPINLTLNGVPSDLPRDTYHGIYGIAQFDLSFSIQCSENFAGPSCNMTSAPTGPPSGIAGTTTSADRTTSTDRTTGSPTTLLGIVIGVVVGVALVAILCFIVLFFVCRQRKIKRTEYLTNESPDSAGAIAIKDFDNPVYDEKESVKVKDSTSAVNNSDTSGKNKTAVGNPGDNLYSKPTAKSNRATSQAKREGEERVFQNSIYGHDIVSNEYSKTSAAGNTANNARASSSNQTNGLASTGGAALKPDSHHGVAQPSSDLYDMPQQPSGQYEVARTPNNERYDVTHPSSEKQANLPAGKYDVAHLPTDMYDVAHVPSEHVQTGPVEDYDVAHPPGTRQAPLPANTRAQFDDDQYDVAHPSSNGRPAKYIPPPSTSSSKQPQFDDAQYDVAHPLAGSHPAQYDDVVVPTSNGLYDVAHAPPPAVSGTRYEMMDGNDYDVADAPASRSSSAGMNHLEDNPRYESSDLQGVNNTYSVADGHLKPSGNGGHQYSVIQRN